MLYTGERLALALALAAVWAESGAGWLGASRIALAARIMTRNLLLLGGF